MVINLIQIMFRGAERFGNSGGAADKVISLIAKSVPSLIRIGYKYQNQSLKSNSRTL